MAMSAVSVLNGLEPQAFTEGLIRCCGSQRWADAMLAARPFVSEAALFEVSDEAWAATSEADWLEAFRHHPKIGDRESLRQKFASTATWAANEQSGTSAASEDVLAALAEGNEAYERKFGFIFIVCATGKTAAEMLELLQARLPNDRETELRIAAGEQHKITRLRLEKWLQS
jgi:2-oxo-4-hydroxy-4-carboxy-5-ureidoimidazoline decarboxylase